MMESPCEAIQPDKSADLADKIIHELLRIARQWVVLRFLLDEEIRQNGTVVLDDLNGQTFQHQTALFSVINELAKQGLIVWTAGTEGHHPDGIRLTQHGRHFVVHILDSPHHQSIRQTIKDSHCENLEQLVELLEKVFHRLET